MADIFVDFSATNNGDGTTAAPAGSPGGVGAFNTLVPTSGTGLVFAASSGDKVWIRRASKSVVVTQGWLINNTNVNYIGWPISGDPNFSGRPASGTSNGWDADAAQVATITSSTVTTGGTGPAAVVTVQSNSSQNFERIKFEYTGSSSIVALATTVQASFNNCTMNQSSTSTSAALDSRAAITCTNCTLTANSETTGTLYTNGAATAFEMEFINCTFQANALTSGTLANIAQNGNTYFINCTFSSTSVTQTGIGITIAASCSCYMYACTLNCSSTAAQTQLNVAATGVLVCLGLTMASGRQVILSSNCFLNFRQFTQTVIASTYAIQLSSNGNVVSGSNITFIAGNPTGDIQVGPGNYYFLQNAIFASSSPFGPSPVNFPGVWSSDDGGSVGFWKYSGQKGNVSSNAVARTGGETFSLKLDLNSGSSPFWKQMIPILPGFETIWVSVPASVSTITIFGAHKNYSGSPPTQDVLWFETDYLQNASGGVRAFASSRTVAQTALTADGSSWTGDTSLTTFKMTLTFTPGQACLIPIRIFLAKRVTSAFVYIDPKPVVT